jgi:hypothetical protein
MEQILGTNAVVRCSTTQLRRFTVCLSSILCFASRLPLLNATVKALSTCSSPTNAFPPFRLLPAPCGLHAPDRLHQLPSFSSSAAPLVVALLPALHSMLLRLAPPHTMTISISLTLAAHPRFA